MADPPRTFTLTDPDGAPLDTHVPDEAVNHQYASGKVKFAPGGRVPIVLDGQSGTIGTEELDSAIQDHDAKLNVGDGNLGTAAMTSAISGVPGLMSAAFWAKEHILGDKKGAEQMRMEAEAAEADHPWLHLAGSLATGVALTGGLGAEEVIAKTGLEGAEAAQAGRSAAQVSEAYNAAKTAAQAQAATGTTLGSSIAKAARFANPFEAVGQVGAAVGGLVGETHPFLQSALRVGTEGALLSAASGIDEDSLGNHETTAESILTNLEHGALFGGTLGLVSTGAGRVLSAAGRISDRLTEAQLGGTGKELAAAGKRFGRGTLGADANKIKQERGVGSFASAEDKLDAFKAENLDRGKAVLSSIRDIDGSYEGLKYADLRSELQKTAAARLGEIDLDGGPGQKIYDRILKEVDDAAGWKPPPEKVPFTMTQDEEYRRIKSELKLPEIEPEIKRPPPSEERAYWRDAMVREGLDPAMEHVVEKPTPGMGKDYVAWRDATIRDLGAKMNAGTVTPEERALFGNVMQNPAVAFMEQHNAGIEARNARRLALREATSDELLRKYENDVNRRNAVKEAHAEAYELAGKNVQGALARHEKLHTNNAERVRRENADIRVSHETVWGARVKVDEAIPYNRALPWNNSADKMKLAVRSVMEKHIEDSMDRVAAKAGQSPEMTGRYIRAKMAYGRSSEILKMATRGEGKAAGAFGKIGGHMGLGGHALGFGAALVMGHPFAGAAMMLGLAGARKYAAPVAASIMYKASRIAELRALTAETQIAMRRGVRASVLGGEVNTAKVAIPNLPPHEMRATAVDAMRQVLRTANDPELAHRLSMLDPSLPILAPKVNAAVQAKARQVIQLLAAKVPQHIQAAIQRGDKVSASDLTDSQARGFYEAAAAASDARWATDMASQGKLSPNGANFTKAVYPVLSGEHSATLQRMGSLDSLSGGRMSQTKLIQSDRGLSTRPAYLMALQLSAAKLAQGSQPTGTPKGMTHATGGSSGGNKGLSAGASGLATMSEMIESGPPGRRGRKGSLGGF